ncbi:MAG: MATE family efflux transporter [Planctomycetes bacterium]|nr:MATE family efflux transporter [Planctomycetota bacterium]
MGSGPTPRDDPPGVPPATLDAWRDLREVLGMSLPVIVAMASHTMMGVVDSVMLADYSPYALAASGAAGVMAFVVAAFIFGTMNCTSTFVSQSIGRGESEECARYTWQGLYFGLAAQAAVVPLMVAPRWAFGVFGLDARVEGPAAVYFGLRMAHVAGSAAYASLASFFQGIGRPSIPMWAAIAANIFNVAADYALIYGHWGFPEMGIAGAAVATGAASYLQVVLLLAVFLSRPMHEAFRTRSHPGFDAARFGRLMAIGAPSGLTFMLDVASWAVFTNALIGRLGPNILAANTAVHAITSLSFMPTVGMNKGITVLVGQYIGRGDIPAAKRMTYLGLKLAMAYMFVMGLLFVALPGPLMSFFVSNDPKVLASDRAAILSAGKTMLMLAAIYQAFDALWIVSIGALRGAGDTRFPAIVCIGTAWGFLLPLGLLLTRTLGWGYVGAWVAAAVQVAVVGCILFWRFTSEAWRKIDIFEGVGVQAGAQAGVSPLGIPDSAFQIPDSPPRGGE